MTLTEPRARLLRKLLKWERMLVWAMSPADKRQVPWLSMRGLVHVENAGRKFEAAIRPTDATRAVLAEHEASK